MALGKLVKTGSLVVTGVLLGGGYYHITHKSQK